MKCECCSNKGWVIAKTLYSCAVILCKECYSSIGEEIVEYIKGDK